VTTQLQLQIYEYQYQVKKEQNYLSHRKTQLIYVSNIT